MHMYSKRWQKVSQAALRWVYGGDPCGLKQLSANSLLIPSVSKHKKSALVRQVHSQSIPPGPWRWRTQESIHPGQIMTDPEKPIMWHFILGSFHSGIEQKKKKIFFISVDFLATENVCCKYFSKSNEPRCIGCLTAVWCRWPGKFKDTLLSFLENKHHKIDPLPLFMNRERKHLANLLETHLINKNSSQINTHFPLYSTHQDVKMKISQSGWISW